MNRIKCLRKSRNLSQAEFGKMFNVDQTAVSNWEKGKNSIDTKTLENISSEFKVPIEFVLGKEFKVKHKYDYWTNDEKEDYTEALKNGYEDFVLFKHGNGYFYEDTSESTSSSAEENEIKSILEVARSDKEMRIMFSTLAKAKAKDIEAVQHLIKYFKNDG